MDDEYKDCPFCGNKVAPHVYMSDGTEKWTKVRCKVCGVETVPCNSDYKTLLLWNTRHGEQ